MVGLVQYAAGLLAALLAVGGILAVITGRNKRRLAGLLTDARQIAPEDGVDAGELVHVRGAVEPADSQGTFTSPIRGDEDAVLAAWEIEEKVDFGKTRSWENAARGVQSTAFHLTGEDGETLVDAGDRVVGNETDEFVTPTAAAVARGVGMSDRQCFFEEFDVHVETDYGEEPPARVAEWLERTDGVGVEPMAGAADAVVDESKRRYSEASVQAGDEVEVLGRAEEGEPVKGAPGERLILRPSEDAPLYVSSRPLDEMSDGSGEIWLGVGLLVAAVGIGASAFLPL